jgi:hypothetical protein
MHFNSIETLSTMMKTANYCHSKIVLVNKNNLNFQIYIVSQLSLSLILNKDYIKSYNSPATEKIVKYQKIPHTVINLNREIFLC